MHSARSRPPDVIATLPAFKRLLWLWLALLAIGAAVMLWHPDWGISLLWGFSVCLVPALVFARLSGQIRGATEINKSVGQFYRAESVKLLLTAALFAVVFTRDVTIHPAVLLGAFITAQIAQLVVTAASVRHRKSQQSVG